MLYIMSINFPAKLVKKIIICAKISKRKSLWITHCHRILQNFTKILRFVHNLSAFALLTFDRMPFLRLTMCYLRMADGTPIR